MRGAEHGTGPAAQGDGFQKAKVPSWRGSRARVTFGPLFTVGRGPWDWEMGVGDDDGAFECMSLLVAWVGGVSRGRYVVD
jgi:hypothetical protein